MILHSLLLIQCEHLVPLLVQTEVLNLIVLVARAVIMLLPYSGEGQIDV